MRCVQEDLYNNWTRRLTASADQSHLSHVLEVWVNMSVKQEEASGAKRGCDMKVKQITIRLGIRRTETTIH